MNANDITIASSAMLIDLTIRGWSGKKQDREVADEVGSAKGATASNAGTYQKNLLAGSEELKAIQQYASIIRQWHVARTLPWADSGTRLLPAVSFTSYMSELGVHEAHYNQLVQEFASAYSLLIQAAQFKLGALFRHSDYPDPLEIPGKFELRSSTYPLPTSGDFRVDIGNEGLRALKEDFEKRQNNRINEAMGEVRARVKDVLTRLSNQLRVEDDGKRGRVHDSTIETALELSDALMGFNFVQDPEIDQLSREMRKVLDGYDISDLRKDDVVRGYAKEEIESLLSKFSL